MFKKIFNLVLVALFFVAVVSPVSFAKAEKWGIDTDHTHVTFGVRYLGLSKVKGNFS